MPAGTELEQVVEGFPIVALGVRRRDSVEDHLSKPGLGGGEGLPCPAVRCWRRCRFANYLAHSFANYPAP
jgi:hypothetical protein